MSSLRRTEALLPSSDWNRIEHRVAAFFSLFFETILSCLLNHYHASPSLKFTLKDVKAQASWHLSNLPEGLTAKGPKTHV